MYVQDYITKGNWSFNLGFAAISTTGWRRTGRLSPGSESLQHQADQYHSSRFVRAHAGTPFNENLVLSSIGCNYAVLNPLLACRSPERHAAESGLRNEFHAGIEQAFGKYLVFSGEYIWKYTHNGYDFSVLGNTPITFPIEWHNSKIPGYAGRVSVPELPWIHGAGGVLQRGGALLPRRRSAERVPPGGAAGVRSASTTTRSSTRPRTAISAVEARAVARLQLALRQRPGGRATHRATGSARITIARNRRPSTGNRRRIDKMCSETR